MYAQQVVQKQDAKSIEYARALITRPSITPEDAGCQDWLIEQLKRLGYSCQQFEVNGVSNLVARIGQGGKNIGFVGHTDVVPPGPLDKWRTSPFEPTIQDDFLIGRGSADMKTGLAAMLSAFERFTNAGGAMNNTFYWLITSDEEGEAEYGSKWIVEYLAKQNVALDMCIVGEPSSTHKTGDAIKLGRRGSLSGKLIVYGKQGHVAYPQYAVNAIHIMGKIVAGLQAIEWDSGTSDFPGSSLQVTHVESGTFTDNLVPGQCEVCFNIRYSARYDREQLNIKVSEVIEKITDNFKLSWDRPCDPYLTSTKSNGCLIEAIEKAIHLNTGSFPILSTSGGTSDGRFYASSETQVVEIGVPNQTIHQVNERIQITDLVLLENIYTDLLTELL
ncbi:succinyl-diaminopimelate desuccinylase [Thalassotalea sp. M1531]|uniref:Succinyl-diaminopimelate desuccinylase n=2 Tax=Thalassotalea algicola TaxID=2716224 RepID=A0A7Y0LAP9_9GAMM|nr:succinyl-diaminopimelate desuccinylase [Thalassotalea algicola]